MNSPAQWMNEVIYSSIMVCRSSIRPAPASPPPTMEHHHAFKPSSLRLYSAPPTPSPSDLSLFCYSRLAQAAAISSPLATIDLPQRLQKISPSRDRFIFAAFGPQSRKCTYFFSSSSSLWICVTFSLTFINLSLP